MKFLRLDLLRFGPFTNVSLPFDSAQFGLHVIYGPNEAGKSSSLRAITQLLYGIPHECDDSFLHPNPTLRIGAVLESADGVRLEMIRRKGKSKTLRGADDACEISESQLASLLGGVDQTAFQQRFGLSYQELVKGGSAICAGKGDAGTILFAAGSGIGNVRGIQQQLCEDADAFFKFKGSTQKVNKSVSELEQLRRAIKEVQLSSQEWELHDTALRQAETRREEIQAKLLAMRSEQGRMERVISALPFIGQRMLNRTAHALVATAPILPESFSTRRIKASTDLRVAESQHGEATVALAQNAAELAELQPPDSLIARADEVKQLKEDLGKHRKALKDRVGLVGDRQRLEDDARTILQELSADCPLDQAQALQIPKKQRARIQQLGNSWSELNKALENANAAEAKARRELQRIAEKLQQLADCRDAAELNDALVRARAEGDLSERLRQAQAAVAKDEAQIRIDLQKLPLWTGTLEQLETLATPSTETIDEFDRELTEAGNANTLLLKTAAEIRVSVSKSEDGIERIRSQHEVPTEADLDAARTRRDEGWRILLHHWQRNAVLDGDAEQFIQEFSPGDDLPAAFASSLRATDQIADRLRREAAQVAEKVLLLTQLKEAQRQLREVEAQVAEADARRREIQERWQELWQELGIVPRSPREMRAWSTQQSALVKSAESLRKQRNDVQEFSSRVDAHRVTLGGCLERLNEPVSTTDESLGALMDRCAKVVKTIQAEQDRHRSLVKDKDRIAGELADAEQSVVDAQQKLSDWRDDWAESVAAVQLEREATPTDADAALELLNDLDQKVKAADALRVRIEGIDEDSEEFIQTTARLIVATAADLANLPPDQGATQLHERLIQAERTQTSLDRLRKQSEEHVEKQRSAAARIEHSRAALEQMCSEAGCTSAEELPEAERKSAERKALEEEAAQIQKQLTGLAGATPLDEFIAAASEFDIDALEPRVAQLSGQIEALEQELGEVQKAIGSEQTELKKMDGNAHAAADQERAEELLARLRSDAEQYARLRVASAVLQRAVERFRKKNQGPILEKGSRIFNELTLGSFEGLRADYNDKGDPVLVGVRPGGLGLDVSGMSDGTRDQLYLALRLASLDVYVEERGPFPFIVDDLLVNFDDERSAAALKVLAALAQKTQILFFTHHEHLAELAARHVDGQTLCVHRLGNSNAVRSA